MKQLVFAGGIILIAVILISVASRSSQEAASAQEPPQAPAVTLQAASGATILFKTQNGQDRGDVAAQTLELPHLVLYRNGELTDPQDRTLVVAVTGIAAPSSGVTVTLEVRTEHGNPDPGRGADESILVWGESQRIAGGAGGTQAAATTLFVHEFAKTVISGTDTIATPTDYFQVDVTVTDAAHAVGAPLYEFSREYAFLMERQWVVQLPQGPEESEGAAPDELVVYACDMFPFQRDIREPTTRLLREQVPGYIQTELVPALVEASRVQTDEWGFPWHPAWTSYRTGDDTERLSVALTDGHTWFHGRAYPRAHSGISINVSGGENASYDTLTDGILSSFHHELFHNLQRDINQSLGGDGNVDGKDGAWQFFSEGTAVLASSVAQPAVQLTQPPGTRSYLSNVNPFLQSGLLTDLNKSYERMSPYRAALYWRFLYEGCGGMTEGAENPAAGMGIIREALIALYSQEVVDISQSTDLVAALPAIMDQALGNTASCPFRTYQESLDHFARAIYGLRLEGGRCTGPAKHDGCGFYDPQGLYREPPADRVVYSGVEGVYQDAIGSSYGMDFVEVALDADANGGSLVLEFYGVPGADAAFGVQLWKLVDLEGGGRSRSLQPQGSALATLTDAGANGHHLFVIRTVNTAEFNRLALIITRIDAQESSDPIGQYTIVLRPAAAGDAPGVSD
jgi:hypothetical protein